MSIGKATGTLSRSKAGHVCIGLKGKNLALRAPQEIPLGEAEQDAVEDGVSALKPPVEAGRRAHSRRPAPRHIGADLVQITTVQLALPAAEGGTKD